MRESTELGVSCSFIGNKGYSCRYMWMTSKWLEEKQNLSSHVEEMMKNVDIDETTSFLDRENLGCTQRECKPNETIIEEYRENVRITNFCWRNWKITREGQTSRANCSAVLRHVRICSKMRWAILWIGKQESVATVKKVSSPCLDDHRSKHEELESVRELSEVCWQIVLKCLHLTRIWRPDILWSVNKLARSVTKLTQACDRRLARLISYIHHTNDFRQYRHLANTALHCRLGLFQD